MEHPIQILITFILIGTLLKLSFWRFWQACLFGVLCGAFVVVSCRWAVLQSKTQLADFLGNTAIMQNAAVLVTIESAIFFAFCIAELLTRRSRWWSPLPRWYPGLLIFPALFWLQTQLIFAMPGGDFAATSWALAAGAAVLIPLLSYGARRLLPERELRLEMLFLASLLVCIIGLVATVNGNVTYAAVKESTDPKAIALAAGVFVVLFCAGFVWNRLKWRKSNPQK